MEPVDKKRMLLRMCVGGLIALAALILVVPYFYFFFRKYLIPPDDRGGQPISFPNPKDAITSKRGFALSCVIFAAAVLMLVTHAQTGLTVSTIGVVIGLSPCSLPERTPEICFGTWTMPRCCSSWGFLWR